MSSSSFAEQYQELLGSAKTKTGGRWRVPRKKTEEDAQEDGEEADRIVEDALERERRQRQASELPPGERDEQAACTVQEMKSKTKTSAKEGAESARRARKMAEEARYIGIETAQQLGKQTEQLENAQNDVENIHSNLGDAEAVTYELQGGFWGDIIPFRKPFSAYERAGSATVERDSETARRGVGGVDLSAMKKGKTSTAAVPKDPQIALRQKKDAEEANAAKNPEKSSDKGKFKGMVSKLTQKLRSNSLSDSKPPKKREDQKDKIPQKTIETTNSTETDIRWNEDVIKNAVEDPERQRTALLNAKNKSKKSSKSSGSSSVGNTNEEGEDDDDFAPTVESYLNKQDVELDRISMALSDMKDIAIRMNEEMKYQEQIIDELVVNTEDASFRLRGDLKKVKRIH
ncbi:hypothetical protein GpartN1_g3546.t1 [Galdieria partita]|uniref:t-SNARE coiled-coil homology domain-containing protein n=1 Tax=Galdieria partita TaxID=83374 RepID=A0A9C7UQM9_9RHOD|nr:hypothetical protein GpartN1_g3546.t1 [Galdieria partita]